MSERIIISNNDSPRRRDRRPSAIDALLVLFKAALDSRRLSEFTMIEEPASTRHLKESLLDSKGRGADPMEALAKLAEEATKCAVAEVTLTDGVWPLRRSKRVRIIRPSSVRYWSFVETGEFTPGIQAEELERRWALTYDYQRRFLLQRSLEQQFSSAAGIDGELDR
jgi:hypothetical protein